VEAALLTDPSNQELLKLKADLEEVIELTKDLIQTQLEEQKKSSYIEPANSSSYEAKYDFKSKNRTPVRNWKAGDKCMAKWNEDGQLYDATIEAINYETGEVNVVFEAYQNRSTASLLELKERKIRNEVFPSNNNK
jgi:survival of motor neuron-related-splicing factor 30